jgi:hypothetical protein
MGWDGIKVRYKGCSCSPHSGLMVCSMDGSPGQFGGLVGVCTVQYLLRPEKGFNRAKASLDLHVASLLVF